MQHQAEQVHFAVCIYVYALCRSSKKGSPPVESPSPVSSKPTTPRSDERQRKWSKGSAAKQQRQQQASPKCRSEIPDDSSQSACDVGDKV